MIHCNNAAVQHCCSAKKQKGFSLVEILVVATIASLLAAMGLVSYTSANQGARDGKRKSDLEQVRAALELYRTENGAYPNDTEFDDMLVTIGGFLTNSQIVDPKNTAPYQYSYEINPLGGSCAGRDYALCTSLEKNGPVQHCLCNP